MPGLATHWLKKPPMSRLEPQQSNGFAAMPSHGLLLDRCMIDRRNAPAHARQLYVMGTCSDRKSHLHSHTHARTHVHNKKLCTSHRPTDHQNHHHFVQMRSRTHFLDTDARRQKAVCCSRELEWNVAISVALRRAKGRPPPRWTPRIMDHWLKSARLRSTGKYCRLPTAPRAGAPRPKSTKAANAKGVLVSVASLTLTVARCVSCLRDGRRRSLTPRPPGREPCECPSSNSAAGRICAEMRSRRLAGGLSCAGWCAADAAAERTQTPLGARADLARRAPTPSAEQLECTLTLGSLRARRLGSDPGVNLVDVLALHSEGRGDGRWEATVEKREGEYVAGWRERDDHDDRVRDERDGVCGGALDCAHVARGELAAAQHTREQAD
eukprot:scaffold298789_cov23-Tisochrysis_lutea.AAC.1